MRSISTGHNEPLNSLFEKVFPEDTYFINSVFDVGFDLRQSKMQNRIMGLKQGSAAQVAGLSENMPFAGSVSIYMNDMTKKVKVRITRDGNDEIIEYFPIREIHIPQLRSSAFTSHSF